jgi:hypothetical protein
MKSSESKNSLAELNPPEPICFICLEESSPNAALIDSSLLRSCGCKFYTHAECWNTWRRDKSDYDCPYCSKRSLHLSLPMTAPFQQDYTAYIYSEKKRSCWSWKKFILVSIVIGVSIAFFLAFFLER